jgi:2-oxoglutarate dehydrogenase E2 component (dihydrolipoamide succinyltransferase)
MPAAARVLAERAIPAAAVTPTGPGGRMLKEDAERVASAPPPTAAPATGAVPPPVPAAEGRPEEVVPLSLIRRKIAERLLAAQNTMALLTTFNEVDMSAILRLRAQFQDKFQERYHVKLGFMSFFVKAVIEALKDVPALNAEIRDQSIVYRNYYDVGVAIGGGRGLVVPVLRNAERLGLAGIEQAIADFATRAKDNKLTPAELTGGTFTITNGGVYGSLLSTPLINAPQSGVLGMHAIQERPVARDGQVVIRPMMYLALTYDHRIVDGREAVTFLRRVKELAEEPARILLEA